MDCGGVASNVWGCVERLVQALRGGLVFRRGAIAEFTLVSISPPHDPNAPLVLVRSKLAVANTTVEGVG